MDTYYKNLNNEIKEYFNILSPEFPEWLFEYINTPEMQRIHTINVGCGCNYSKIYNTKYWYSNLDHSVGVALIIWNFTKDKKQTLAGLFHDIATPVFKHCIDFMHGDSETQESTEEETSDIIKNSKEIMYLLKRDGIKLEEVDDYKIYPIADNETPRLAADRLEYSFSNSTIYFDAWDLDKVKEIYNNILVLKNEDGLDELGFKDKEIAEEYINILSKVWPKWISDKGRTVMQFLGDICKSMGNAGYLTIDDLYTLSEAEIIDKIKNCEDKYLSNGFKMFEEAIIVHKSLTPVEDKYCINAITKRRYIVPLTKTEKGIFRINEISEKADNQITEYLNCPNGGYYTYFDFDFKPYEKKM